MPPAIRPFTRDGQVAAELGLAAGVLPAEDRRVEGLRGVEIGCAVVDPARGAVRPGGVAGGHGSSSVGREEEPSHRAPTVPRGRPRPRGSEVPAEVPAAAEVAAEVAAAESPKPPPPQSPELQSPPSPSWSPKSRPPSSRPPRPAPSGLIPPPATPAAAVAAAPAAAEAAAVAAAVAAVAGLLRPLADVALRDLEGVLGQPVGLARLARARPPGRCRAMPSAASRCRCASASRVRASGPTAPRRVLMKSRGRRGRRAGGEQRLVEQPPRPGGPGSGRRAPPTAPAPGRGRPPRAAAARPAGRPGEPSAGRSAASARGERRLGAGDLRLQAAAVAVLDQRARLGEVVLGLRPDGGQPLLGRGEVVGQPVDRRRAASRSAPTASSAPRSRPTDRPVWPDCLVLPGQVHAPARPPPAGRRPRARSRRPTSPPPSAYRRCSAASLLLLHGQPLLQLRDPPAAGPRPPAARCAPSRAARRGPRPAP